MEWPDILHSIDIFKSLPGAYLFSKLAGCERLPTATINRQAQN